MSSDEPAAARSASGGRALLVRFAELGASTQAAIPGLYAWAITVVPAAWSRGAPLAAKLFAGIGFLALVTAPFVEAAATKLVVPHAATDTADATPRRPPRWAGPTAARLWSVWGFVLSSAVVWALAPNALSSARLDAVRGVLGMAGWALFAFASAGPSLRPDPQAAARVVAGTPLRPRSDLPRGDGAYVAAGVVMAFAMQVVGWGIPSPERSVLVRLVTIVCGIAVLGGTTSIALARHGKRIAASPALRLRRGGLWLALLLIAVGSGIALTSAMR